MIRGDDGGMKEGRKNERYSESFCANENRLPQNSRHVTHEIESVRPYGVTLRHPGGIRMRGGIV